MKSLAPTLIEDEPHQGFLKMSLKILLTMETQPEFGTLVIHQFIEWQVGQAGPGSLEPFATLLDPPRRQHQQVCPCRGPSLEGPCSDNTAAAVPFGQAQFTDESRSDMLSTG